jgi:hypothetical protein
MAERIAVIRLPARSLGERCCGVSAITSQPHDLASGKRGVRMEDVAERRLAGASCNEKGAPIRERRGSAQARELRQ